MVPGEIYPKYLITGYPIKIFYSVAYFYGEECWRDFYPLLSGERRDGEEGKGFLGGEVKKEFPPKKLEGIQV